MWGLKRWLEKVCCRLLWTVWPWWGARGKRERRQCRDRMYSVLPRHTVFLYHRKKTWRLRDLPHLLLPDRHSETTLALGLEDRLGAKTSPIYCWRDGWQPASMHRCGSQALPDSTAPLFYSGGLGEKQMLGCVFFGFEPVFWPTRVLVPAFRCVYLGSLGRGWNAFISSSPKLTMLVTRKAEGSGERWVEEEDTGSRPAREGIFHAQTYFPSIFLITPTLYDLPSGFLAECFVWSCSWHVAKSVLKVCMFVVKR